MSRPAIVVAAIVALTLLAWSAWTFFSGEFCDWPLWTRAGIGSHAWGVCGR